MGTGWRPHRAHVTGTDHIMTTTKPIDVSPDTLSSWLENGEAVLIDVREDFEHASEHIPGAHHVPLSKFDAETVTKCAGSRRPVFQCRSGKRSADAATRFASACDGDTFHLQGGIEAWKAAGNTTVKPAGAPRIDVMRQVQITAGSLVLLGVILGSTVSPWLYAIAAFIGAGLVFAGASGWCGMAMLLRKMPWNARLG